MEISIIHQVHLHDSVLAVLRLLFLLVPSLSLCGDTQGRLVLPRVGACFPFLPDRSMIDACVHAVYTVYGGIVGYYT
jgi:hypothetical protein